MKKLLASAACAAMAFAAVAAPVQAASGVNKAEQEILDYMEKGVNIQGNAIAYGKNSDEYKTAQEYFDLDGVDLSESDAKVIKDAAKNTQAFLEANWDAEVTPEMVQKLIDVMQPALNTMGMKISYDAVNDKLTVTDAAGNILTEESGFIYGTPADNTDKKKEPAKGETVKEKVKNPGGLEKTGEDFSSTYAIFGSLAVILAGAGIVATKKKAVQE